MSSTCDKAPRLIHLPEVLHRVGMQRTTLYERVGAGSFPKPIKLGRANVWVEAEINAWVTETIAAARADERAKRPSRIPNGRASSAL